MKRFLFFSALVIWCSSGFAQQSDKPPVEYIESSSPLPGGGVVTSFSNNGRQMATAGTTFRKTNDFQTENSLVNPQPMRSVLNSISSAAPPAGTIVGPQPVTAMQTSATATMLRLPNLGVANNWNRSQSFRPTCNGCSASAYGPANLSGMSTPASSLPPTLGSTINQPAIQNPGFSTSVNSFGGGVYRPIVQLQNMPPNAYAGQGIFGSPKLYVDGQPVRNLLRYLILP